MYIRSSYSLVYKSSIIPTGKSIFLSISWPEVDQTTSFIIILLSLADTDKDVVRCKA